MRAVLAAVVGRRRCTLVSYSGAAVCFVAPLRMGVSPRLMHRVIFVRGADVLARGGVHTLRRPIRRHRASV